MKVKTVIPHKRLLGIVEPLSDPGVIKMQGPSKPAWGWYHNEEERASVLTAFLADELGGCDWPCINNAGKPYTCRQPERIGLKLVRDGMVYCFQVDLDNHSEKDKGCDWTVYVEQLAKMFGVQPMIFRSGKARAFTTTKAPAS